MEIINKIGKKFIDFLPIEQKIQSTRSNSLIETTTEKECLEQQKNETFVVESETTPPNSKPAGRAPLTKAEAGHFYEKELETKKVINSTYFSNIYSIFLFNAININL